MLLTSLFKNISVLVGASILWVDNTFTPWVWLLLVLFAVSAIMNGANESVVLKKVSHSAWAVAIPLVPLYLNHQLPWQTWAQLITVILSFSFTYTMLPEVTRYWKSHKLPGYMLLNGVEKSIETEIGNELKTLEGKLPGNAASSELPNASPPSGTGGGVA